MIINKDLIIYWFNKHDISIISIYVCSLIIVENSVINNSSDKLEYIDLTISLLLSELVNDKKITNKQKNIYREQLRADNILLNNLKNIVIDLTNNPNLLQQDKFSTKNRCFPCKKRNIF